MRRSCLAIVVGSLLGLAPGCHRAAPGHRGDPAVHPDPGPAKVPPRAEARPGAAATPTRARPPAARAPSPAPARRPPAFASSTSRDDGGKVYKGRRLRLDKPKPFTRLVAGQEPRRTLRYRLHKGETYTWLATVSQRTLLRTEKKCAPLTRDPRTLPRPHRTLISGYRVKLTTTVTDAMPGKLVLRTRFSDVHLTLPPSLTSQRALLVSMLGNTAYTVKMTPRGRVSFFELNKLASADLRRELSRLRTPLSSLQPVLPGAAVGPGASWQHLRRLVSNEAGGQVVTLVDTGYRLTGIDTKTSPPKATLEVHTAITLQGKLMGKAFGGQGRAHSRVVIDAQRGVMLSARGTSRICTAIMGQTSTNQTTFAQRLVSTTAATAAPAKPGAARPTPAKPDAARPTPARPAPARPVPRSAP